MLVVDQNALHLANSCGVASRRSRQGRDVHSGHTKGELVDVPRGVQTAGNHADIRQRNDVVSSELVFQRQVVVIDQGAAFLGIPGIEADGTDYAATDTLVAVDVVDGGRQEGGRSARGRHRP